MPIGSDPNQTVPAWLKVDEQIPADRRPTFMLRFLSERDRRKVESLLEEASRQSDVTAGVTLLAQVLAIGVADYRNMTVRGEPVKPGTALEEFLTASELWELAYLVLLKPQLAEADKKKSLSLSTSPPANSALPA